MADLNCPQGAARPIATQVGHYAERGRATPARALCVNIRYRWTEKGWGEGNSCG